jgi:hypothetical protein
MKRLKCLTSAPARLSVAMPLIFGLATIAATPTVEAVGIEVVNILNGAVDVDQNGVINAADDLSDFALWCNDAAAVKLDIRDGFVDVTEGGTITTGDDLANCDFTDENEGVPISNQGDVINGCVDIDESGSCTDADDATQIQLFNLP